MFCHNNRCNLLHALHSTPIFQHSIWSFITARKLTPDKVRRTTVVGDQQSSLHTVLFAATEMMMMTITYIMTYYSAPISSIVSRVS